jgi:hypothetical protein
MGPLEVGATTIELRLRKEVVEASSGTGKPSV